jgi:hypothetical protein
LKLPFLELTEVALKHELKRLEQLGYDKDAILTIHAHDNVPPEQVIPVLDHMHRWNETHETPRLVAAVPEDFFRHMEEKYGDRLPVVRGECRLWFEGPGYDFVPGRRAAVEMLEAERYWSLDQIHGGPVYPSQTFALLTNDLVESAAHGGGAYMVSRLQEEYIRHRRNALNADLASRAYYLRRAGHASLSQRVRTDVPAIAVSNALSWPRTGVVEVPVTESVFPKGSSLVDAMTGRAVRCEIEPWRGDDTIGMDPRQITRKTFAGEVGDALLRFTATDVPGVGYRLYNIVAQGEPPRPPVTRRLAGSPSVESPFFRIAFDGNGNIKGFYDKAHQRELMPSNDSEPLAGARVLLKKFADKDEVEHVLHHRIALTPGRMSMVEGPVQKRISIERPGDIIYRTDITLYEELARIRLQHFVDLDEMAKLDVSRHYKIQIGLPLSYVPDLTRRYFDSGDIVRGHDTSHIGPDEGDYTYGSIQHGCYFTDGSHGLFLSSCELVGMPAGNSNPEDRCLRPILSCDPARVYGMGQQSVIDLVFSTDGGEAGGMDPNRPADAAEIYRRCWDGVMPLRAVESRCGSLENIYVPGNSLEGTGQSLLHVGPANVALLALKAARLGRPNQYTLRLLEIGGKSGTVARVRLPPEPIEAWLADQSERVVERLALEDGCVDVPLDAHEIVTVRFDVKPVRPKELE